MQIEYAQYAILNNPETSPSLRLNAGKKRRRAAICSVKGQWPVKRYTSRFSIGPSSLAEFAFAMLMQN